MPATDTVDLSGLGGVLAAVLRPPADYGPLLRRVAVLARSEMLKCFDGARDPDGVPWTPLAASTIRRRRKGRGRGSPKPLRDTGLLMLSCTAAGARGHVEQYTATSLVIGSNLDRAGWQNDGTRTIPARPFVGLSDRVQDIVAGMVADEVVRQLRGK